MRHLGQCADVKRPDLGVQPAVLTAGPWLHQLGIHSMASSSFSGVLRVTYGGSGAVGYWRCVSPRCWFLSNLGTLKKQKQIVAGAFKNSRIDGQKAPKICRNRLPVRGIVASLKATPTAQVTIFSTRAVLTTTEHIWPYFSIHSDTTEK